MIRKLVILNIDLKLDAKFFWATPPTWYPREFVKLFDILLNTRWSIVSSLLLEALRKIWWKLWAHSGWEASIWTINKIVWMAIVESEIYWFPIRIILSYKIFYSHCLPSSMKSKWKKKSFGLLARSLLGWARKSTQKKVSIIGHGKMIFLSFVQDLLMEQLEISCSQTLSKTNWWLM